MEGARDPEGVGGQGEGDEEVDEDAEEGDEPPLVRLGVHDDEDDQGQEQRQAQTPSTPLEIQAGQEESPVTWRGTGAP